VNFGDVVEVDFGVPMGSEAGYVRPSIVVTADSFLRFRPSTIYVVPLTSAPRNFPSHVEILPDEFDGLSKPCTALVEQLRAVAIARCKPLDGNIGPSAGHQTLDLVAMIMGMP